MANMKTLTIGGTTYTIVDEEARAAIGKVDISGIGDGTVKGAILVLKELIENGGGGGSSETAGAFTVDVGPESDYGESEECSVEEAYFGKLVSSNVPTLAQMEACTMTAYFENEVTFVLYEPDVVDVYDDGTTYAIYFRYGAENTLDHPGPHLIVCKGAYCSDGIYVVFDTMSESCESLYANTAELNSATIDFPEV